VAQNVPFVTGSFAQAVTATSGSTPAVNPFQTIERKDVGLILKIKPQISEGGTVKLDIMQEVSSVASTAVTGAVDLVTDKRSIETKVVVDDGNTIVLGGLIQNQSAETEQAVPWLGSIPIIGALFRYRENRSKKVNLMIFLRPVVIRGPEAGYRVSADRYDYIRGHADNDEQRRGLDRIAPQRPALADQPEVLGPPNTPQESRP
jgi:general secretion pathway protein D